MFVQRLVLALDNVDRTLAAKANNYLNVRKMDGYAKNRFAFCLARQAAE